MFDAITRVKQPSLQHVVGEKGPEISDVRVVVDSGAAAVEGDFAGFLWGEGGRGGGREDGQANMMGKRGTAVVENARIRFTLCENRKGRDQGNMVEEKPGGDGTYWS